MLSSLLLGEECWPEAAFFFHIPAFFFLLASLASIFFSLAFPFILYFLWDNIVLSSLYRILFLFLLSGGSGVLSH